MANLSPETALVFRWTCRNIYYGSNNGFRGNTARINHKGRITMAKSTTTKATRSTKATKATATKATKAKAAAPKAKKVVAPAPAPATKVDTKIAKQVVQLRDKKLMSWAQIGAQFGFAPRTARRAYDSIKGEGAHHGLLPNKGGRTVAA